ncbi:MAG: NAD(+)/NADH kinase [Clostridia bacterium]|nr:NAD(+)/NADH kinase [Clostridia bacterium]
MKKAIIIPNYLKENSIDFSYVAKELLIKNGYQVQVLDEKELPKEKTEFALVLGGDGTLLRACKKLYTHDIPMLGINYGNLGYLTGCNPENALEAIEKIVSGDFTIEERAMLSGEVIRNGENVYSFVALNECAFYRASFLKAFTMEIYINGVFTHNVVGDGLIVATPTGSTSYNMSVGGPVLTPNADNMVITPVSPIYFPKSSLVTNGADNIDIAIKVNSVTKIGTPSLQIDGDVAFELQNGDTVKIRKHVKCAKIIKVSDRSFYQVLSQKLSKATLDNV